jgi:hypothetical protein
MRRANRVDFARYRAWGWKEPNTHIYLEYFTQQFPALRYIHMIRHGLDMAYSSNDQQLKNWVWLYDVTVPASKSDLPEAALRYWIAANQVAVGQAERLLGVRFMMLNYDALCESSQPVIDQLLDFLGWDEIAPEVRTRLYAMPKMPESAGRYIDVGPLPFSDEQIAAV